MFHTQLLTGPLKFNRILMNNDDYQSQINITL